MDTVREKLVLVADDESSLREMLGRCLAARNCRVFGTGDGAEAVRLARAEKPALILLDLKMPGRGGAEVLRELRGGIQTRMIPVVMLTSSAEIGDKLAAFELGADDYITKPFDIKELAARVEGQLRASRRRLAADALTRLPGGPMIEAEVKRRIAGGFPFAFLRADIDGLTGFNEARGYPAGDELLLAAAAALLDALAAEGLPDDFAGHAGADDFAAVTAPGKAESVARRLAEGFDAAAARFAAAPGDGAPTLSIGVAVSAGGKTEHYARVTETASELAGFLKERPVKGRSAYLLDRRRDF